MDCLEPELDINLETLQKCTYRYLQQLAKIYGLPRNFKKVHLIQLILAKRNNEHEHADNIIQQIRLERQHLAATSPKKTNRRKKSIQNQDVSSTMRAISLSPIARPKQPIMYYSSELHSKLHMYRQNIYRQLQPPSDRVLRSCNLMYKKPNYVDNELVIGIIKGERSGHEFKMNYSSKVVKKRNVLGVRKQSQVAPLAAPPPEPSTSDKSTNCFIDRQHNNIKALEFKTPDGKISKLNALVHKTREDYENFKRCVPQMMTIQDIINSNIDSRALNKETLKSETFTNTKRSITHPTVTFTNSDHMFVNANDTSRRSTHRQTPKTSDAIFTNATRTYSNRNRTSTNTSHTSTNTEDVSTNTELTSTNTSETASNPSDFFANFIEKDCVVDSVNEIGTQTCDESPIDLTDENCKVYYHKKIRAEKVRSNRLSVQREQKAQLPKISEVFSKFNNVNKDYSQPLYVQVYDDVQIPVPASSLTLEPFYNISRQQLAQRALTIANPELTTVNPGLTTANPQSTSTPEVVTITPNMTDVTWGNIKPNLSADTPAETRCTYSKNTVVHSFVQPPAYPPVGEVFYDASFSSAAPYPYRYEPVFVLGQGQAGDSTYNSFYEGASTNSGLLSATAASIPQMVEDALEIISQDGEYQERMSREGEGAQCVLCAWAGDRGRREAHVREEHSTEIHKQLQNAWKLTFSLASLLNQTVWLSGVSEMNSVLYVLSTKFDAPNSLKIAISTLTSDLDIKMGSITVINKVSSQGYTWQGPLQDIPINMPYENNGDYLSLDLDRLDLVPDNILSRFSNGESVTEADLHNVQVEVLIKIYD